MSYSKGDTASTAGALVRRGSSGEIGDGATATEIRTLASLLVQYGGSPTKLFRWMSGALTALKDITFDSSGRLKVYASSAEQLVPIMADLPAQYAWNKETTDAAAGTATLERYFGPVYTTSVTSTTGYLYPSAAITCVGGDYATINVYWRYDSSGQVLVAHLSLQDSSLTAFDPAPLTMDITTIPVAGKLTVEITKTGAGVQLPPLQVELFGTRTP